MRVGISLPVRELQDDVEKIKAFAVAAEELGLTHLRVPEQIIRPGSGPLHESLITLSFVAAVTSEIELVPSVVMLPARQTVLLAKQAATLDRLSGGRLRLGIGIGKEPAEYEAQGMDFHTRGAKSASQIKLLRKLWTEEKVDFQSRWDRVVGQGINPLPIQQPIPIWMGVAAEPIPRVRKRIGELADGWFSLATPEQFPAIRDDIYKAAEAAGRVPSSLGIEAGVAVVGPRESEWKDRLTNWRDTGLTHLCLRTLGGGLKTDEHIECMRQAVAELPV